MTQAAGTAPIAGFAGEEQTDQRILVASQWQLIRWRFFAAQAGRHLVSCTRDFLLRRHLCRIRCAI